MGVLAGSLLVVCAWSAQAQVPVSTTMDRIVAVVNNDIITLSDVRSARLLQLVPSTDTDDTIVRTLVDRRLVLTEMRRFQAPEPAREVVAARVQAWEATLGGADPAALATSAGVSLTFVERWLADDLRRETYLQQRFAALDGDRRAEAIRGWIDGLRTRADIVYR